MHKKCQLELLVLPRRVLKSKVGIVRWPSLMAEQPERTDISWVYMFSVLNVLLLEAYAEICTGRSRIATR